MKQIVKWTAEGAVKGETRVFCDVRHASVAGDMLVSRKAHGVGCESRWHREYVVFVLDRESLCQGLFY